MRSILLRPKKKQKRIRKKPRKRNRKLTSCKRLVTQINKERHFYLKETKNTKPNILLFT